MSNEFSELKNLSKKEATFGGCLSIFIVAFFLTIIDFSFCSDKNTSHDKNVVNENTSYSIGGIICDGKTVYVMNKDMYVPGNEEIAKELNRFIARNPNDKLGYLEFIYDNEWCFHHFFEGDEVVVYSHNAAGYRIRNLRTSEIGYMPSSCLSRK